MLKIELSEELKEKIQKNGNIRTVEIVTYIINNVKNATTKKELHNTALKDISFNGKYPKGGEFDTWNGVMYLEF